MIPYKSYIILMTLNYGNYGIFLIMGNAGFVSSTVGKVPKPNTLPSPKALDCDHNV